MPLGNINTQKEAAKTAKPILLVDFVWADGSYYYAATDSITYSGKTYQARITQETLTAIQAFSDEGIDMTPSVTITLADSDKIIYNEIELVKGFKSAIVTLTFLFWNVGTSDFSTDAITKFVGICGSPQMEDTTLTLTAQNKLNMTLKVLPTETIQALCLWNFPTTATARAANAASDRPGCKYCPDGAGGLARGNYSTGTTPFTTCNYSKTDCQARGMYTSDSSSRQTGNFSGIQWSPPASTNSRPYGGGFEEVMNSSNPSKYTQRIPLAYGVVWCNARMLNQPNDANYTRMEVLVCRGLVDYIYQVVVNDEVIPHGPGVDPIFPNVPPNVLTNADALILGWWQGVNNGSIFGKPNALVPWSGQSDPYSDMVVIAITVISQIAAPGSVPRIQVLINGPKVRVYSGPGVYSIASTTNPVWALADMLQWVGWTYDDLLIAEWVNAANQAFAIIPYIDMFGNSIVHNRYSISMFIESQRGASDCVRGVRNAIKALLLPDYSNGGLLKPFMLGTLTYQQSTPVDGSNFNTAMPSYHPDGTSATGYYAYYFSDANGTIAVDSSGKSTFTIAQNNLQDAPNSIDVSFFDSDNTYSLDSLTLQEDEDIALTGQIIPGDYPMDGANSYDQLQRVGKNYFARMLRGNLRAAADGETIGDTRGTLRPTFETSFRAVKLQAGHIVLLDFYQYGLSQVPFRVMKIEPTTNFERMKLTLELHNDAHWVDSFGQTGAPPWTSPEQGAKTLTVRGWMPGGAPFLMDTQDPLFDNGLIGGVVPPGVYEPMMDIGQVSYVTNADGTATASITIKGYYPLNSPSAAPPPYVPLEGFTADTGGAFVGGEIVWVSITGQNSQGEGLGSTPLPIYIAPGTSTNTAQVQSLFWLDGVTLGNVYAGMSPDKLYLQMPTSSTGGSYVASGGTTGKPTTITFTNRLDCDTGAPDSKASEIVFRAKKVFWHGVFEALVASSVNNGDGTTSITLVMPIDGAQFAVNHWAGRKLSLLWRNSAQSSEPIYQSLLTVVSNTVDTLRVNNDKYGLLTFYPGDAITMRAAPTYGTDSYGDYFEDLDYVNILNPNYATLPGLDITGQLVGKYARIVDGTGEGCSAIILSQANGFSPLNTTTRVYTAPFLVQPDSTSIIIIEDSTWEVTKSTGSFSVASNGVPLQMQIEFDNLVNQGIVIQAIVLDNNGVPSPDLNSPLIECWMASSYGPLISTGEAPPPEFALTGSNGFINVEWTGFDWWTVAPTWPTANITTIASFSLSVEYWDMSGPDTALTLTSNLANSWDVSQANTIPLSGPLNTRLSSIIVIEEELFIVLSQDPVTHVATVLRNLWFTTGTYAGQPWFGYFGYVLPAPHASGTRVYQLSHQVLTFPVRENYFIDLLTPGSSIYGDLTEIFLPEVQIFFANIWVTNTFGDSQSTQEVYTAPTTGICPVIGTTYGPVGQGVCVTGTNARRTITMYLAENLFIGTDIADPIVLASPISPHQIRYFATLPPVGAHITAEVLYDGILLANIDIAPTGGTGATPIVAVPINGGFLYAVTNIPAGASITLNITGVGTTYPGYGLGIFIDI